MESRMIPEPKPRPLPPGTSAYADWSRHLAAAPATTAAARPAVLRGALVMPRDAIAFRKAVADGTVMIDASLPGLPDDPEESCLIYWNEAESGLPKGGMAALADVLMESHPVTLEQASEPQPEAQPTHALRRATGPSGPIVAVIDDGIGFLNARFCVADPATRNGLPFRTRFHAVWLQSLRATPTALGALATGRILTRGVIDAMLSQGPRLEESATYRALNQALLHPSAPRLSERGTSHGTHVLDLAAGAWPEDAADPVRNWPLLAVQLPPEAVDDTAGTLLEPLLVQGVRWCLRQAEAISNTAPVVINISYATFAGPKDGTKSVEAQMARAVAKWRARTGREARIVLAFGNARLTRQAARMVLVPGATQGIRWQLPPDDHTASYLELRPDAPADMGRLTLALTPPRGTAQVIGPIPAESWVPVLGSAGNELGRFYHIGPRVTAPGTVSPAHGLLAMAPTEAKGSRPRATHGGWGIAVSVTGAAAVPLRLEVQRDDTPMGYRLNGRQSYLDHPLAEGWDAESRDYGAPDSGCPITRAGTHSSFVTSPHPAMISVAAARDDTGGPSRYSAEGAAWTVTGPDLSALADRSPGGAPGLVAAGTFSGSGRSLDGSSAAAARVTRALALHLAAGPSAPGPAEIAALVAAHGQPATDTARLGAGVLTAPRESVRL
jgi:hypothetical protein